MIQLREQQAVGQYRFPGAILPAPAHRPRWVHADADGCWVASWDGIFRCHLDGEAVRIDEHRVTESATLASPSEFMTVADAIRKPRPSTEITHPLCLGGLILKLRRQPRPATQSISDRSTPGRVGM